MIFCMILQLIVMMLKLIENNEFHIRSYVFLELNSKITLNN